jgi:RND family efflux transporter MFP subunit
MKRFVSGIFIAAIIIGCIISYRKPGGLPATVADPQPSVLVSTIKLSMGSLPATVAAYGTVVAGPNAESTIAMRTNGIVSSVAVVAGQHVAMGDPLETVAPNEQSIVDYQKAVGALNVARANREHVALLLASHLATNADLATADQAVKDAAVSLAALNAIGANKPKTITAPFTGIVSAVLAAPGTAQSVGAPLMRIVDPNALAAIVGIPPEQAEAVKIGDNVAITLLNLGGTTSGRVMQIGGILDPQTGLRDITLSLTGNAPLGEPVKAVITIGALAGYVVPRDAIQSDETDDYAFQVDDKNVARRVAVKILGTQEKSTVIAPDLNTALPFVTDGAYQLDDGMLVRMSP